MTNVQDGKATQASARDKPLSGQPTVLGRLSRGRAMYIGFY